MARKVSKVGKLAREYCARYSELNNTEVAKILRREHPYVYDNVEHARDNVRYCRRRSGKRKRSDVKDPVPYQRPSDQPLATNTSGDFLPKILIYDIETTPIQAWTWSCYKAFINPEMVIKPSQILCYAAKWLGNDAIIFGSGKGKKTDKHLCKEIWKLFDEADIIVAHNGKAFDTKTVQGRMLYHKMKPPSPFKQIDTLKQVKAMAKIGINKLDYLGRYLEIGKKVEHEGFELWLKCMANDDAAWQRMEKYNIQDIMLLEELYLHLRPWDKKHPNVGIIYDDKETRCVVCGSTNLKDEAHASYTAVNVFPTFRCKDCGKVMRSAKADKVEKGEKKRNVPRNSI